MNYGEATRMNYGEATRMPFDGADEVVEKRATMQETVDAITVDLTRLAQMLNELCAKMAGAYGECIPEAPNGAPLLMRLEELTDRTRYCLKVAGTMIEIVGNR